MIHEVDEALRNLLRNDALTGTEVDVVFDAPTKDWSSRRNAPTVDVYLYDIREDMRRREVGRFDQRGADGRVSARVQPPRWYKLSYLITAWTQRPEDEHRLLSAILRRLLMDDRIPENVLTGTLSGLAYPIPYTCALPPPEDRALSDVWSALGGELKPSLDLVVVAPFDFRRQIDFGPPVLEGPQLEVAPATGSATTGSATTASATKGRRRGGKAAEGDDAAAAAAAAEARAAEEAAAAAHRGPSEERVASRHGNPGRRLFITELPR